MGQQKLWWRFGVAVMVCTAAADSPVAAQSDGSLEEAYARDCPQHQDTALCNMLSDAMQKADAGQSSKGSNSELLTVDGAHVGSNDSQSVDRVADLLSGPDKQSAELWGPLLKAVGSTYEIDDYAYRRVGWVDNRSAIEVETRGPGGVARQKFKPAGNGRLSVTTTLNDGSLNETIGNFGVNSDVIEVETATTRSVTIYNGPEFKLQTVKLVNGAWVDGTTITGRRLSPEAAPARREAIETRIVWGRLVDYVNRAWRSDKDMLLFRWDAKNVLRVQQFLPIGRPIWNMTYSPDPNRKGWFVSENGKGLQMLPDGTILIEDHYKFGKRGLIFSDGALRAVKGRIEGDGFVFQEAVPVSGEHVYRLMHQAEFEVFNGTIRTYLADQKEKAESDGSSGLFAALAMATGAALAGGNVEHVMGAAMKGAELSTDNEMTRSVLAGQGDRMIASGVQSMTQRHAPPNLGIPGSAPRAAGASLAADASSAASAPLSAVPARRPIYGWCYAINTGGRAVYMSGVGSRNLSVDEQEGWRSAMLTEFRQQISGSYSHAQCDIDDDSDFSYTRGNIEAANPARIPWSPN